jgi:hypothetical protein
MKTLLMTTALIFASGTAFAATEGRMFNGCWMVQAEGTNVFSKPKGRCENPPREGRGEDRVGMTPASAPDEDDGGDGPGEGPDDGPDHGEGPGEGPGDGEGDGEGDGGDQGDGGDGDGPGDDSNAV